MDGLTMFFMFTSIIVAAIMVWINTKSGKKWLNSL